MKKLGMLFLSLFVILGMTGCDSSSSSQKEIEDLGLSDCEKGLEDLEKKDYASAVAAFTRATHVCPTNFDAQLYLSLAQLKNNQLKDATQSVQIARLLCPDSAQALFLDGVMAFRQSDYVRAKKAFQSIRNEKSLPSTLRARAASAQGVIELKQSKFDLARISFLSALVLDRAYAPAWYHLGVLSRNTYRFLDAAQDQFSLAAALMAKENPSDPHISRIRTEILPQIKKALQEARTPKGPRESAKAAKLLSQGEALLRKAEQQKNVTQKRLLTKQALKNLALAYQADAYSYEVALAYAQLLSRQAKTAQDVSTALTAWRTAIEQNPVRQANYYAAALFAYQNRNWMVSSQILNHALAHDSQNIQTLDLLIATLQKTGQGHLARAWTTYRAQIQKR